MVGESPFIRYMYLHYHAYYVVSRNEKNMSTTQSKIIVIITYCIITEVYVNKTKKKWIIIII